MEQATLRPSCKASKRATQRTTPGLTLIAGVDLELWRTCQEEMAAVACALWTLSRSVKGQTIQVTRMLIIRWLIELHGCSLVCVRESHTTACVGKPSHARGMKGLVNTDN